MVDGGVENEELWRLCDEAWGEGEDTSLLW